MAPLRWWQEFGQSVEQKEAYADAYADVLQKYGIKAYAGSRLDQLITNALGAFAPFAYN